MWRSKSKTRLGWPSFTPNATYPPAPHYALGSYQEYLATGSASLQLVARSPAPVTRFPGSVPGTCFAGSRSSQSPPFAPPAPHRLPGFVRWFRCYYGEVRLLGFVHHRLRLLVFPMRTSGIPPLAKPEISRFPHKERPHMPGSPTTPGWTGPRDNVPVHVAFRDYDHVGTRDYLAFAGE